VPATVLLADLQRRLRLWEAGWLTEAWLKAEEAPLQSDGAVTFPSTCMLLHSFFFLGWPSGTIGPYYPGYPILYSV